MRVQIYFGIAVLDSDGVEISDFYDSLVRDVVIENRILLTLTTE
jgi:hypothetical protein